MRKIVTFISMVFICICGYAQTIDPVLLEEMGQRRDNEKIRVFVIMRQQYDQQQLNRRAAHYTTRAERREFVVNELKQFAESSQYDLRQSLAEMQRNELVSEPKTLWIANAIFFEATRDAILSLADRSDIMVIGFDEERNWLPDGEEAQPADPTREIASNVTQVNADQVWSLGYTGQGVVVAVVDTGVNYNHLDLADHLWDGGPEFPHHGYDVYNNDNDPMDDHGHGTHCAGTVCGDGTAGSQTGMAPDATLMCVKCLSKEGSCSDFHVINGMQWAVDHGCDVISMSLGGHGHSGAEKTILRNTCVNVLTSGVIASIAAGNDGHRLGAYPIPKNVGLPGGCPPPYLDPEQALNPGGLSCSVCVGAVDVNDQAAYFTSHGPCDWSDSDYADYPYTPDSQTEFGLIRPDVCAPGVAIKSADYSSNNGYTSKNGTSMATPCVAGCMALMLSKDIYATPADVCRILEETAAPLATGKSNIYGYGRVDALAAINAMSFCPLTLDSFTVNDGQGNNDGKLNAGESVMLNLSLTNDSNVALDGATMVISIESEYVTITNGTANLPHFGAGQTRTINNMFSFTLNEDTPAKKVIQFKAETFVNGESIGTFMIGVMVYGHLLKFTEVSVLNDNNGNGVLDAGETANLHVTITNLGNEPAFSIVGALSTAYPYIVINSNDKSFGSIEVNGQASANFNVRLMGSAPVSYTIGFSLDLVDANDKYTNVEFEYWKKAITLTSNPGGAGTLSGGGYYGPGQSCTITASANPGYAFTRWTVNDETVSYYPTYTFEATGEAEYVAYFQALPSSVVIGDGDGTNENLPVHFYSIYYALSQQIYTADELNLGACEISSVSFFDTDDVNTREVSIYMVNTSKTAFDSNTDWIAVTEADRVYSGRVHFSTGAWTTVYFDRLFAYDGSSNIALIVDDNSAYASLNAASCRVYSTDSYQALYVYGFDPNYDPYNPEYTGTLLMEKNHVGFGIVSYDYTVTTSANPADGGTVSDGGICYYHQPFTLTATPNEGYVFNNWTKNGTKAYHVSTTQINVTETAEYVANFQQVEGILIGEANLLNSYLPSYNYYSLSEQIYTADELNTEACEISSVSFYNPGSSTSRNWNVYMAHTNKTAFDSDTDWIPVTEADLVFSGSLTLTAYGWTTVYFSTPFVYDGSSNVVLVVDDNSNSYYYYSCRAFGTEGSQAIRIYGSGTNYDPSNPSGYTGTLMTMKNQVIFGMPSYDYTVTVSVGPDGGGTVSGGGLCYLNQPITLTATPNEGYIFTNWTKNGEVVSYVSHYNLSVTESANYVANFELAPDGIVIGDGTYTNANLPTYYYYSLTEQIYTSAEMGGSPCQISSVSFFNTGTSTRTRKMDIYMVGTDKTSFEDTSDWIPVSESDLVFSGNVTFTAHNWVTVYFSTPFVFDGSSNVALVVDDNTNMFNVYTSCRAFGTDTNQAICISGFGTNYDPNNPTGYTGTLMLVKNQVIFGLPSYEYTVTATANPEEGGTVSGGEGYYYMGQSCTLTATANDGYCFYYWTKNGSVVSSDATYTFPVMGNMNLVANFGPPMSISVISNPEEGGTVSGGGEYGYNQPCTLTATPNEGYVFNYWTKNGSMVSGISPATVTVTAEAEYVANFQQMDGIIIGDAAHANANLPSCFDYYYSMTQQIYTADEINSEACEISSVSFFNTGYYSTRNLTIYMVNTNKTAFANSRDWITVTDADMVYTGNVTFDEEMYSWTTIYFDTPFYYDGSSNVALVVNDETGDWWGGTTCRTFDTQAPQAIYVNDDYYYTPINPYNPSGYNGTLMSEKNQVIFGMPTYEYMVTLTAEPEEGGIVNGGGGPYYYGQHIPISATASPGYVFNNWTKYDEYYEYSDVVSFFSNDKIPVTETADYVANFQQMDGIVIGDATHTNAYLPNCSDYSYSMTQQIYTADEMHGEACEITSVSFFNTGYYDTRDITIYMVNTNKTAFASETDWITVTETDRVYSGSVTFEGTYYWTTIYFDTPFYYDGSSNVALIVNDATGNYWRYGTTCRTFDTQAPQAIYVHDDYSYAPIDPYNPSEYYGTLLWEKNQVVFGVAVYQYMVTVSANPTEGGTVSGGGGPYYYGQQIPVSATANPGYVFNNWTKVDEYGWYYDVVSCFSTDYLPVTETCGFVANFQQTDDIIIGDAVQTNACLPSCFDYPYSMTQQIYTADEINNEACELSSVSFFNTGYYSGSRNLAIYMVNTDKTAFASESDWITVTEADMVFSGNVTLEETSWTTIYFNTTFNYDGSSNVALIVNDKTGDYGWGTTCRTFDTSDPQAIYIRDYYYEHFNPYNPSYYGTLMSEKNQVIFGVAVYQYMVTLSADPEEGGTVSGGGGPYYYGQSIPISATANNGYVFDKWTKDGNAVSYFTTDTIAVTETAEYVASFDQFDGIIIGDAIKTNAYLPANYYYSLSQQIYTAEEMGVDEACEISSVSFYNTGHSLTRKFTIYMVNTDKSSFESSSDWITVTEADQVFSGSVTMSAEGWATIYFDTPFAYDGVSNVALVVDNDSKSSGSSVFRVIDSDPNQAIRSSSYSFNYDPCNPVGFTGTRVSVKNQVLFGIPSYDYTVTATANPADGGTVTGGEGLHYYGRPVTLTAKANEGYVFNNWTKDGTVVSYLSTYTLSVTESSEYVANFQKVDNGFAVGDATYTNSNLPTYSYYPYTLSQQIYTADEMGSEATQISSISFFNTGSNRTRNMSIYMVHTNKTVFENNYDWIAVTEADRVFSGSVTMAASDWANIIFDVPFLYNGTSNVVLIVDDNSGSWSSGVSCRVFDAGGNQAIRVCGYSPNYNPYNPSIYNGTRYSVKNQIIFGVTPLPVQQTIALSAGTNWVSFNVEITLDDLKAALVEASGNTSIVIVSQDNGQAIWNGRLWTGQLRTLELTRMYKIIVPADCEIALEAIPIDPANYPVTIKSGINWIGFPFSESMSIATAFGDFATRLDVVKSQDSGQATWNGQLWTGQLKNLEPGKGYIYQSAATENRTFTFPTSAK